MSDTFTLFGSTHLLTLLTVFVVAVVLAVLGRQNTFNKQISIGLAAVLIVNEIIYVALLIKTGRWDVQYHLPLNLCDLTIFAAFFALLTRRQWIWEVAYFWTLAGTLHAVITPDLDVTFPDYIYIKFFLTHGLLIAIVIYLAVGRRRAIYLNSIWRVLGISNLYAVMVGTYNWFSGANYSYLCRKPFGSSILDYLGPWPYYILSLEVILIVSLLFYYLPYWFIDRSKTGASK